MRIRTVALAVCCAAIATAYHPPAQATQTRSAAFDPRDLDGIWAYSTVTPLERSAEFADKPFLTDEEAAAFERRFIERSDRDRRDRSSAAADLGGAYNEFWFDRGTRVARVRGKNVTSLIVDPPDGRIPAMTADGQARAEARAAARRAHPTDGPEDFSLADRCLMFGAGPPMVPGPYNNFVQIIRTDDHVIIHNEMIHDARLIPLSAAPHARQAVRRWQGDSRGRWDGNTLVVDTTNFTDKTNFRGASDRLHLVERFTRVDARTVLYEFTVDDPSTFTRPWSAAVPLTKTNDRIFEYACHEGNYALENLLRGARFQERASSVK